MGAGALAAGLAIGWGTHVLLSAGDPAIASGSPHRAPATAAPVPLNPPATGSIPIASGSPLPAGPGTPGPAAQSPTLAAPDAKRHRRRGPVPPERGEFVRERFKATQEWLQNAPDDRYAIQLVTVNSGELRKLEDFLLRASATVPAGELFVYSVKIDGRQHYRVAYGSYASPEQALDAIKGLPPLFSAYHPYYRSIERMRSQNRQ